MTVFLPGHQAHSRHESPEVLDRPRRTESRSVNIHLARIVVNEHFPQLRSNEIDCPEGAQGFSGTRVYRVRDGLNTYCLKCQPTSLSVSKLLATHRLLARMFELGMTCIPVPCQTRSGSSSVTTKEGVWQLEPWMPGRADYWAAPSDERLAAACHMLARWHRAAVASAEGNGWFTTQASATAPVVHERIQTLKWYLDGTLDQIERALIREPSATWRDLGIPLTTYVRRLAPTVLGELMSAACWEVPLQPVMRDIWHDHVLFTGNEVTGLIDFNAAQTDTIAADLSRLLGSLIGSSTEGWLCGLKAYEEIRPLSDTERRLIPILDQSNLLLSGLTWLKRRYIQNLNLESEDRIFERLRRILERLEFKLGSAIWVP